MSSDALYHPPLLGQLVVDGLSRYDDRPCLFLGDTVASYRQVRERTSQFIQASLPRASGRDRRSQCSRPIGPRSSTTWPR